MEIALSAPPPAPATAPTLLDRFARLTRMHPALYLLIYLRLRAGLRRILRGRKSVGNQVIFVVGAILCLLWLASAILSMRQSTRSKVQDVRDIMPVALLGVCFLTAITSAGDKAIAFTPGEVDQLFPGPFTRRQLLAYKLIQSTLAALLTALVLSIVMLKHARWWPACFAGVFSSLLLIQFFSIALLLAGQAIGASAYSRFRRYAIAGALLLVVYAGRMWMKAGLTNGKAALELFRASPIGAALVAPLEPFAQLMTAGTSAELLQYLGLSLVIVLALLVVVFNLDAWYTETAIAASERRYAKIQRVRTGSFLSVGVSKTAHWTLPALPWAGGAGPIAWRQLTSAARSSRGLLLLLLIVAVGAAPALSMAQSDGHIYRFLVGVIIWLTFLCSSMMNFDFRGDVDHMENLKSLPLSASGVVVGQLLVPVLLLSLCHCLLIGGAAVTLPAYRGFLIAAMFLTVPFNALLFGSENLIFLLFPSRPAAVSPGDFQVLGRKFIFLFAKVVALSICCTIALLFGVFVYGLTNRGLFPATLVGWTILSAEAIAMLPLIGWAYARFDPSIHVPS